MDSRRNGRRSRQGRLQLATLDHCVPARRVRSPASRLRDRTRLGCCRRSAATEHCAALAKRRDFLGPSEARAPDWFHGSPYGVVLRSALRAALETSIMLADMVGVLNRSNGSLRPVGRESDWAERGALPDLLAVLGFENLLRRGRRSGEMSRQASSLFTVSELHARPMAVARKELDSALLESAAHRLDVSETALGRSRISTLHAFHGRYR